MTDTMSTSRIEAFSDGIFAIAITLLVLELHEPEGDNLLRGLLEEWPQFVAYLVTFFIIGIMWVNHHSMFRQIARADRTLLFLNLLLMLWMALLPFPTMLVARNLGDGGFNASVAMATYSLNLTLAAIAFSALWYHAARADLLTVTLAGPEIRRSVVRFSMGTAVYAASIGVSFLSPIAALVIVFALAMYYLFEQVTTT